MKQLVKESLKEFLYELSGEVLKPKRNVPMKFDPRQHPELTPEFFNLINIAYAEVGGYAKIDKPEDILSHVEWDYWEGEDIHGTPDFDIIMFGQKTKYGIKFSGVGHDGEKETKRYYLDKRAEDLKSLGFYNEVSGKLAEILINKYNCPIVDDEEEARKVLSKYVITWIGKLEGHSGDGWYSRPIGGKTYNKILLGRPINVK